MRRVETIFAATLAVLAISAFARTPGDKITFDYTFDRYIKEYRKPYVRGSAEYELRAQNFKASLAEVVRHNSNARRTFTKGLNHMSDWSKDETARLRGARHNAGYKSQYEVPYKSSGVKPPDTVDWRLAQPAVLTAIKDQGSCGDCWAHSVTETIESAYARATGNLLVLSQQQVTSCTPANQSCYACDGSWTSLGFDYVAGGGANASFGLVEEWVYPFLSWEGINYACNATMTKPWSNGLKTSVQITNWTRVSPNNQTAIMEALHTLGPLSILVDASGWVPYESGIFTECATYQPYGNFGLDHAVQLIGYGHDSIYDMDYWIVRNSWSAGWGENGYVRLARNNTPECGLTYAMDCSFNRPNMTSCGPCGVLVDAIFPFVNVTKRTLK